MTAREINAIVMTPSQEVIGIVDTTTGDTIRCFSGPPHSPGDVIKSPDRSDDSGLPTPHCRIVERADPQFVSAMKDRLMVEAARAGIRGPLRFAKGIWYVVIED